MPLAFVFLPFFPLLLFHHLSLGGVVSPSLSWFWAVTTLVMESASSISAKKSGIVAWSAFNSTRLQLKPYVLPWDFCFLAFSHRERCGENMCESLTEPVGTSARNSLVPNQQQQSFYYRRSSVNEAQEFLAMKYHCFSECRGSNSCYTRLLRPMCVATKN